MTSGDYKPQLRLARLFFDNHWLSHARQKCLAALSLGADVDVEAGNLLREIDRQLLNQPVFDLSQDHVPIAVLLENECIISTLHFRHLENERLKQEAFRQAVYYIDIETSSQCNRKCQYCPNSQNDRFSSNDFIDDSSYALLIRDLSAIDYKKELHFVGYNEPLLYLQDLLSRISLARKALPRATIVVFTNGDYLRRDTLDQLISVGSDEIKISVHLPVGKTYKDESIFSRINKISKRLGTPIVPLAYVKDAHILARLVHDKIRINIYQTDYDRLGSNRASTLENVGPQIDVRTSACLMPIYQFIVGHKGAVVPCCVMVSDDPRNASYVVGNLGETPSIFDIYCGNNFVNWRRSLFNLGPKQAPCRKCSWDVTSPLLNAPGIYEPWQHLMLQTFNDPIVIG